MRIANETRLAAIIFLYLPNGATYINSNDRGVNANIEESLRGSSGSWRRGKSNAHLYCSYVLEFPGISHFADDL